MPNPTHDVLSKFERQDEQDNPRTKINDSHGARFSEQKPERGSKERESKKPDQRKACGTGTKLIRSQNPSYCAE